MITRRVKYVCTKCKSTDHVDLFENESAPSIINCWSCHAGYGMDPMKQMQLRAGMVAVEEPVAASMPQLVPQPQPD